MSIITKTILLLTVSNVFMLSAWYLHLKWVDQRTWFFMAMVSWGIAFFEYNFHIPANRLGSQIFTLPQLQIIQVGMSLLIFVPFSVFVMRTPLKLDYLWAALCLCAAAFFIFRK